MIKENLSARQTIAIIILFLFGSSVIMGVNTDAKQDSWISLLMAIIFSLGLVTIYARIIKLYPGEGLYDIVDKIFGKITSKIIIILMTWYGIHLGALVLRNFSVFITITSLLKTPQLLVIIAMMLLCVYIARSSIATFGKWAMVMLATVLLMVLITIIFSLGNIRIEHLFPMLEHDFKELTVSALKIVSFPFAETVLLLPLACFFQKKESPFKIYSWGMVLGGIVLLVIVLRNLVVVGVPLMTTSYFPSYTAARIIELGDFLTRIEGVITINFVLAGIAKIVVCLIAATKGIAKLFNIKNYKDLVLPTGLFTVAISIILYDNIFEMFEFTDKYWLFIIPYQLVIPILVWIVAEIKSRKPKNAS